MIFSDPLLFAFSILCTGSTLFLLVYYVITLSDLECDYLNAQECCDKLNQWTLPKLILHGFLTFLLLMHGHWVLVVCNLPMTLWMAYEIATVPSGNLGIYDPTEIHNRGQVKKHMKGCMINLGYYFIFFFLYLYCMIVSLLQGDPINRKEEFDVVY